MGTFEIVLISVLSTLGVSGVVLAIVVAFIKLKGKVDVRQLDGVHSEIERLYGRMNSDRNESDSNFNKRVSDIESHFDRNVDDIRRNVDSRFDKLNDKIKKMESDTSKKQLLTD
jgi:hypothetical protein